MHRGPRRTRPARRVARFLCLVVAVVTTAAAAVLAVATTWVPDTGAAPGRAAGTVAAPRTAGGSALLVHETGAGASGANDPAAGTTTSGVVLRSRVTRVAGHLSDVRRERVARQAHATVLGYLEAVSAGDAPWRRFVRSLRPEARVDAPVLGGAEDLGPADARAWFAVAAPHGRAVGVTARLAVTLSSDDGPAVEMTGRLLLTERARGGRRAWQVFGYDLARGTR